MDSGTEELRVDSAGNGEALPFRQVQEAEGSQRQLWGRAGRKRDLAGHQPP